MIQTVSDELPRFLTISASHYCEKARWALDLYGVQVQEERYVPLLHVAMIRKAGGGQTAPALVLPDRVLKESGDILRYLDAQHPDGPRLYPRDASQRAEVEELEKLFDEKLGPHTRRFVYFHMLSMKDLCIDALTDGVSGRQKAGLRFFFPGVRFAMRKAMNINPASAERSKAKVLEVFSLVEERLADGRAFLVGDQFTAADLTFATLASPVLFPPEYIVPFPPLEDLPAELAEELRAFQNRPAGQFGLRMYRDHRNASS